MTEKTPLLSKSLSADFKSLSERFDNLLISLNERLENPSKQFGFIGKPVPTKATDDLNECIAYLSNYLKPALDSRDKLKLEDSQEVASAIASLKQKLVKPTITPAGVSLGSPSQNYVYKMSMFIDALKDTDKEFNTCIPFQRLKNLIYDVRTNVPKVEYGQLNLDALAYSSKPLAATGKEVSSLVDKIVSSVTPALPQPPTDPTAQSLQARLDSLRKPRGGKRKTKKSRGKSRQTRKMISRR